MRRIRSSLAGNAHLFVPGERGGVTAVAAAITRLDGATLTLRCLRPGTLAVGARCVLALATPEGRKRARAVVLEVTDLSLRIALEEPLSGAERRASPRADVVLRLLARRLGDGEAAASRTAPLSLVPAGEGWRTEEVVLSASGMRGPLGAQWVCGDRMELRLHVPGRAGGDHFLTTAEVVRIFDDESPVEQAVRFLDLPEAARLRLGEIVDQARLDDFAEETW